MKPLLIGSVIVGILAFAFVLDKRQTRKDMIVAMDSLYEAKKKIINYDSLESSIRRRVGTKLLDYIRIQDAKIWRMRVRIDSLEAKIKRDSI